MRGKDIVLWYYFISTYKYSIILELFPWLLDIFEHIGDFFNVTLHILFMPYIYSRPYVFSFSKISRPYVYSLPNPDSIVRKRLTKKLHMEKKNTKCKLLLSNCLLSSKTPTESLKPYNVFVLISNPV